MLVEISHYSNLLLTLTLLVFRNKCLENLHREREDDGAVLIPSYLGKGL